MVYQFLIGFFIAVIIALIAYRVKALSRSGAFAAALEGTIIFGLGGLPAAAILMVFFVSGSLLSVLFSDRKRTVNEEYSKGSQRDAVQVLANGGPATVFMLVHGFFPDLIWPWVGYGASLAAVTADTWATELGVLSPGGPRLISTGKPADPGTSGAISLVGILASIGGAGLVAIAETLLWPFATGLPVPGVAFFATITLGGFAGGMIDSYLGAAGQATYYCPTCNRETERHPLHRCGTPTTLRRGWKWFNNEWVNGFCALGGAGFALLLWSFNPGMTGVASSAELSGGTAGTYPVFPLSSPSFNDGQMTPVRYSCDGEHLSPARNRRDTPAGSCSLALIMDVPGESFTHWMFNHIPAELTVISEILPGFEPHPAVWTQGFNRFQGFGSGAPCPPHGPARRVVFELDALDTEPARPENRTASQLQKPMQGQVLGEAHRIGKYGDS